MHDGSMRSRRDCAGAQEPSVMPLVEISAPFAYHEEPFEFFPANEKLDAIPLKEA